MMFYFCFLIYKFMLDKLVFPSYNALTAEEKAIEIWVYFPFSQRLFGYIF